MTFAWPQLLWLLLLPAALLVWDGLRLRRGSKVLAHDKIVRAEAGGARATLAQQGHKPLRHLPRFWFAAGLALACLALARPQWGVVEEQVFEQSREILIALDLSRSMEAPDVKPSRLDRSKLLVESLLDGLKGERVGLVVFSGTAFLQCPLSTDYEIFRDMMPELKPGFLPEAGTNFSALLKTSLEAFSTGEGADRFLIVLSDGEDLDDSWRPLVAKLKERKIRVLALGVGTPEGAMIPDKDGGFVKDERGAVVKSRLAPATLEQLANQTDGRYRDASTWVDLNRLLQETVGSGKQGDFSEKRSARAIERYQWALGASLACFLLSLFFDFPTRVKPRQVSLAGAAGRGAALFFLVALLDSSSSLKALTAEKKPESAPAEAPLVSTVKRLSAKPELRASDYAEFAKRSLDWGRLLQSSQQPVPEGPIRDAILSTDLGANLSPKAADWPTLRRDLEALLKKQENKQQDEQKQQEQNQNQDQQNESKQNQDQQKQDKSSKSQNQQQQQQDQQEQKQKQDQQQQQQQDNQRQSAFDKMEDKAAQQSQPRPEEMQQIGGQDRKQAPENKDPSLVLPLEKLERVKNQDSPARLFKLMEDDKKQQPSGTGNKKTW